MSNQFSLLKQQRFKPYFITQFLGGYNDNVFKTALVTLVAFHATSLSSLNANALATLLPGVFMLPYFLFSATAGQLADKYERAKMIRIIKRIEIIIMMIASVGFYLNNLPILIFALFLMGTHSTFFGPIKFAYLPQHLNKDELMGGNGLVEMGSFIAILLGQIGGAWLGAQTNHAVLTSICVLTVAFLGYQASKGIPLSPSPEPKLVINWNPITETYRNLKFSWQNQTIWLAIIAISWFWFYGATIVAQLPNLAKQALHGDESIFILLLVMFSLGVGAGSLLCEKLSKGKVELGLVLFGGIGLSFFGADFSYSANLIHLKAMPLQDYASFIGLKEAAIHLTHWRLLIDLMLLGMFGGFYIVPLYAKIQTDCEKTHLSRVIAGNNIMNALLMVVSAVLSVWIIGMGYNLSELFMFVAILNITMMVYLSLRQPAYIKTFIKWISQH